MFISINKIANKSRREKGESGSNSNYFSTDCYSDITWIYHRQVF